MSVYVDDFDIQFGRMKMSHMLADSTQELLEMADKIGVNRKWIQGKGTIKEHFDICLAKKQLAIKHGAKTVDMRTLSVMRSKRNQDGTLPKPPQP